MAAGVDPTGPMEEISAHGTISWQVVISNRRVWIVLIVLAVSMTKGVPVNVDALVALMLN